MRFVPWLRKRQPEPIGEAEAYRHSYGKASADVKVVKLPPRRPRDNLVLERGERLRHSFLERLERRRRGGGQQPRER
jgi:hypothetical protein